LHVDWLVTCRYAESDGQIATIVGAGIDVIHVPTFPQGVRMMVAVRLVGAFEELGDQQQHQLNISVHRPDGTSVLTPTGEIAPTLGAQFAAHPGLAQKVPGWLIAPTFALLVQWWADEEGTYTIAVSVGDDEPTRSPVHVLQFSTE
jgi:hypothetical protein